MATELTPGMKEMMIKAGEVRNPTGRPKGTKSARTIVKDFMNKKIESLQGTKVTRFQYLLWSMYEINLELMKELRHSVEDVEESRRKFQVAKASFDNMEDEIGIAPEEIKKAFEKSKRELNSTTKNKKDLLFRLQESQAKLSEFFLKSSGQYLVKREIEQRTNQPLLVTAHKDDLKDAIEDIKNEL